MPGEVAYAASKGALASITRTLADHLAGQAITLNAVNPGPVDTGYARPRPSRPSAAASPKAAGALPTIPLA
jgi:3-oxoacyl-[acyl-carrier protein] reductase